MAPLPVEVHQRDRAEGVAAASFCDDERQHFASETRWLATIDESQNVVPALLYGSFAHATGDEFSDVEFWLFHDPDTRTPLDREAWIARVGDVYGTVLAESGAVVALFAPTLVRGEFHFAPASSIDQIRSWTALGVTANNLDAMVLLDRHAALRAALSALIDVTPAPADPRDVKLLCERFVNWHLMTLDVLARGELARAHMLLGILDSSLLRMARLQHNPLVHWATPSQALERELPADTVQRYYKCTAPADPRQLAYALCATWGWGQELIAAPADREHFTMSAELIPAVTERTTRLATNHQPHRR
jgi:lincosamide nucleotidyltransferase B/F